ncbi:hypothetical protein GCM10023335_10260 [Streptomyces siamensis]|uniref:Transposase n=2 Tax=Streptomyces siamensis TaxID=1274986 RepID=A0ABP9II96_9ACTN
MRRGKAADSRGAPKFVSETLATAIEAGCIGTRILRADSQFYNAGVIAACRPAGAHESTAADHLSPRDCRALSLRLRADGCTDLAVMAVLFFVLGLKLLGDGIGILTS